MDWSRRQNFLVYGKNLFRKDKHFFIATRHERNNIHFPSYWKKSSMDLSNRKFHNSIDNISILIPQRLYRLRIIITCLFRYDIEEITLTFARLTSACCITNSISPGSNPVSSSCPSSSSSSGCFSMLRASVVSSPPLPLAAAVNSGFLNCSAAAVCAATDRSSIFASPKIT